MRACTDSIYVIVSRVIGKMDRLPPNQLGARRIVRAKKIYRRRISPLEEWERPQDFMARYRLPHHKVRELAALFAASESYRGIPTATRGGAISPEDKVCLALRYLATGADYRIIGDTQGVSRATVHRCVDYFVEFLCVNERKYIHPPKDRADLARISEEFGRVHAFPGVIGCVDGTHIAIRKPLVQEQAYISRHGYHSLNVLALCDAHGRLLFVEPSFGGTHHDQYVWDQSTLGRLVKSTTFTGEYFFLGDGGYALTPYMVIPFPSVRTFTPAERRFQELQTSVRSTVERAFGQLKRRWRCIFSQGGGVMLKHPENASCIITACCVLHNIAVDARLPNVPPELTDPDTHVEDSLRRRTATSPQAPHTGNTSTREYAKDDSRYAAGVAHRAKLVYSLFGGRDPRRAEKDRAREEKRRSRLRLAQQRQERT